MRELIYGTLTVVVFLLVIAFLSSLIPAFVRGVLGL